MRKKLHIFIAAAIIFPVIATAQPTHHIAGWADGGYSNIFHGLDNVKDVGGFGYGIGAGYEIRFGNFSILTGAEYQSFGSLSKINNYEVPAHFSYQFPNAANNIDIDGIYSFKNSKENARIGYVNIPLLFGYQFGGRYYAKLGGKYGFNLSGRYESSTSLTITGQDPMLIDPFENMPNHLLVTDIPKEHSDKLTLKPNIALSAEFGVVLDEWIYARTARQARRAANATRPQIRPSYRLGIFADYGLVNINNNPTDIIMQKTIPFDPANPEYVPYLPNPYFVNLHAELVDVQHSPASVLQPISAMNTLAAEKAMVAPFIVGLKFTVTYELRSNKRPPVERPVRPVFTTQILDGETGAPIVAQVLIQKQAKNSQKYNVQVMKSNTSSKTGLVSRAMASTPVLLTITNANYETYIDSLTTPTTVDDTLTIRLTPKPTLIVHVIDAATGANLVAEVSVVNEKKAEVLKGVTDKTTGLISKIMEKGAYSLSASKQGYIFKSEEITSVGKSEVVIALSPIPVEKEEVKIVLKNIFFDFDKSALKPASEPALVELYQFLKSNPNVKIRITGHTDNQGTDAYNDNLSRNRAKAVYDDMAKRGIDKARMSYEGKGKREPIVTNDTEEGRAENRRVELTILNE